MPHVLYNRLGVCSIVVGVPWLHETYGYDADYINIRWIFKELLVSYLFFFFNSEAQWSDILGSSPFSQLSAIVCCSPCKCSSCAKESILQDQEISFRFVKSVCWPWATKLPVAPPFKSRCAPIPCEAGESRRKPTQTLNLKPELHCDISVACLPFGVLSSLSVCMCWAWPLLCLVWLAYAVTSFQNPLKCRHKYNHKHAIQCLFTN